MLNSEFSVHRNTECVIVENNHRIVNNNTSFARCSSSHIHQTTEKCRSPGCVYNVARSLGALLISVGACCAFSECFPCFSFIFHFFVQLANGRQQRVVVLLLKLKPLQVHQVMADEDAVNGVADALDQLSVASSNKSKKPDKIVEKALSAAEVSDSFDFRPPHLHFQLADIVAGQEERIFDEIRTLFSRKKLNGTDRDVKVVFVFLEKVRIVVSSLLSGVGTVFSRPWWTSTMTAARSWRSERRRWPAWTTINPCIRLWASCRPPTRPS